MSCCLVTIGLIGVLGGLLYKFLVWNYGHWKKRGIREAKSYPLLGTFPSTLTQKRHLAAEIKDVYRTYKRTENFVGVYNLRTPQLLILDPDIVHKILVNDFKYFHDNEISTNVDKKSDPILSRNPFFMTGEMWKETRNEIAPGMTPLRIKSVYPVTLQVCKVMTDYIKNQIRMSPIDGIDTNDVCIRFTTEVVTDCVLGIKAQSFTNNPTPIVRMANRIFDFGFTVISHLILTAIIPTLKRFRKIRFFPDDAAEFFSQLVQKAIDLRRAQGNTRKDFLNYMLEIREKKGLSTPQLTSNVLTFLTDGFVTTATAVAHCLLLLARNPKEQDKLLKEILDNLDENGELSFEKLTELPFLDACFHEGLRIFPPAFTSTKLVTAPYQLTNKDGTVLKLNVNDTILLGIHAIQHDEEYYENADLFRPDRFLPENGGHKAYRDRGLFLGFGDGPRVCLGMRFALVQSKAALVEIIKTFKVKCNPRTRTDNTLNPKDLFGGLLGGIWLDFELRN